MFDIYVINLAERTDKMENIYKKFGDKFNLIRIEAIKDEIGWKGCFLSHKKCIEIAKINNLKNIFVIEDDCEPYDDDLIYDKLCNIKKILDENNDWDIWIGGCNKPLPIEKSYIDNECFIKLKRGRNTHMICYNNTSYDFFLNNEMEEPIDCVWYKKINAYTSYPFVAFQKPYVSDIAKKYINSKNIMKRYEEKIGEYVNK